LVRKKWHSLKAGADTSLEYEGATARDLAVQRGHEDIAALLDE
jgi:hypothetical protein